MIVPVAKELPTTLDGWLEYISHQHTTEIAMGLERVRAVWQRMAVDGKPLQAPINIIVGGTNGKGSTCAMMEAILDIAGYKTGFLSSPHLLRYNERIRVSGEEAGDTLLIASFAAVEAARRAARCFNNGIADVIPLTYFEYNVLSALWIFAEQKVEVAILEVGLGGRLDAVNIIDADISIVVSVDLDHQQYLGDTREKIAFEKAHIYRHNRTAIFADTNPPQTLIDYAESIGARLMMLGRDYRYQRMDNQWQFVGEVVSEDGLLQPVTRHSLPIPALRGSYQLKNASAVIAALAALHDQLPVSINQIKRGLLEVQWPGRMQVLPGRPTVVLDVAHNPHAARALEDALGTMGYYEHTYAVFAMLQDKDIDTVIATIKGRIDYWFIAGIPTERGATVEQLADKLDRQAVDGKASNKYSGYTSIANAYAAARERAGENDRILVFGSFYTVAQVLRGLKAH